MAERPNYIMSAQGSLFGSREVIGFGVDDFFVREITRTKANEIVMRNHYSKKFFQASYIHLGLFDGEKIRGVLQYGYAMNPQSMCGVVADTAVDEYLELNRMWLDDGMPRNSESRAISYSVKFIRRKYPKVAWIQSFADERCGRLGVVYQASSFLYCGEHLSTFWELDGVWYHNILMTHKGGGTQARELQARAEEAVRHEFRQFRYVKILKKWARKKLVLPVLPYPKPEGAGAASVEASCSGVV